MAIHARFPSQHTSRLRGIDSRCHWIDDEWRQLVDSDRSRPVYETLFGSNPLLERFGSAWERFDPPPRRRTPWIRQINAPRERLDLGRYDEVARAARPSGQRRFWRRLCLRRAHVVVDASGTQGQVACGFAVHLSRRPSSASGRQRQASVVFEPRIRSLRGELCPHCVRVSRKSHCSHEIPPLPLASGSASFLSMTWAAQALGVTIAALSPTLKKASLRPLAAIPAFPGRMRAPHCQPRKASLGPRSQE